jgi:hypothetical protein
MINGTRDDAENFFKKYSGLQAFEKSLKIE